MMADDREKLEIKVGIYDGLPAIRLSCMRGEARKRTLKPYVEFIRFSRKMAVQIGRELIAAAEGTEDGAIEVLQPASSTPPFLAGGNG